MKNHSALLQELGLTINETKVYNALLTQNSFSATELAAASGVTRTIIYRALEDLIAKGLCVRKSGSTRRYSAIAPEFALNDIIKQKQNTLSDAARMVTELQKIYSENEETESPLEFIQIMKDPRVISAKLEQLSDQAEKEILAFVKGPYLQTKLGKLKEQLKRVRDFNDNRGIDQRGLYEVPQVYDLEHPERYDSNEVQEHIRILQYLHLTNKYGAGQTRVANSVPLKAIIFDRRHIVMMLPTPMVKETKITSLLIDHPDLANSLALLFHFLWESANEWGAFLKDNNINELHISEEKLDG